MGQYYKVVNITKKQVMNPYTFGSGGKLMEFSSDAMSIMQGLAILLADGNGRGGGDLHSENPIIGSWAGDQIVVTGDYADPGKFVEYPQRNLYDVASDYEDISLKVIGLLCEDSWWKQEYYEGWKRRNFEHWDNEIQSFNEKLFGKNGSKMEVESV